MENGNGQQPTARPAVLVVRHATDKCDKCGQTVAPDNDAVRLDLELGGSALVLMGQPRHLLPVEGCEGSPSRAQYLEGQPRDPRPEYPHQGAEAEKIMRDAYQRMLAT